MAPMNLKNKSKADLVAIVRMSGIMPISRAQRMKKAALIEQLEKMNTETDPIEASQQAKESDKDEEALLVTAPGRLSARNMNQKKTTRSPISAERRSVFVAPDEIDESVETKPVRRSVMAAPDLHEDEDSNTYKAATSRSEQTKRTSQRTRPRSAMIPVEIDEKTEAEDNPSQISETTEVKNNLPRTEKKQELNEEEAASPKEPVKRKRGRPPKNAAAASSRSSKNPSNNEDKKSAGAETASVDVITADLVNVQESTVTSAASDTAAETIARDTIDTQDRADALPANLSQEDKNAGPDNKRERKPKNNRNTPKRRTNPKNSKYKAKDESPAQTDPGTGQDTDKAELTPATADQGTESKTERKSETVEKPNEVKETNQESKTAPQQQQARERGERQNLDSGEIVSGVMEIMPDGYGFLRRDNYLQGPKDIYMPPQFIRRFNLREGDFVTGPSRVQREQDRYQALYFIKSVNGVPPEQVSRRPHFDRLTPIYPNERFTLETSKRELSTRIIDLIAPIGKGQRGMIVSPPKAGKTILLQKIANAVSITNPDAKLIVLLIDERPEEVTDMQRSIRGEVVYSTFDKTPENHVKITELVLERAERLVEMGQDVVILLDSLTRMSRAYNLTINPTGRTLSGGLDPGALYGPKRFFGAARNIENGGSLTIVATALIDTGSRMDEVIFEEFKGTGNMEVYLDRKLSEKRIFPAIDINRSGTRREELLLSEQELEAVWSIRRAFGQLDSTNVTETIINLLLKTNDNRHFVSSVNVSLNNKSLFESMRINNNGKSDK